MTVKEAVELTVCKKYNIAIFKRETFQYRERDVFGWMMNRKLVRFVWVSTPDDPCPPLEDEIANSEIEENIAIIPFTSDYAVTIKDNREK